MSTETLRPNAAGDKTLLEPNTGANFECVYEVVPDEEVTTVSTTDASFEKEDLYNLPAHTGAGTINSITVYARCKESTTGQAKIIIKTGGTIYRSAAIALTSSWVTYSQVWATNPGGGSWNWGAIDALQIGVALCDFSGAAEAIWCTQVYVVVDFTYYAQRVIFVD